MKANLKMQFGFYEDNTVEVVVVDEAGRVISNRNFKVPPLMSREEYVCSMQQAFADCIVKESGGSTSIVMGQPHRVHKA